MKRLEGIHLIEANRHRLRFLGPGLGPLVPSRRNSREVKGSRKASSEEGEPSSAPWKEWEKKEMIRICLR